MKPQEVIAFFGTQNAVAKLLKISRPAVCKWMIKNRVPILQQLRLQEISKGKLKAENYL